MTGVEFGVSGLLTRRWLLYGAYTNMQSRIIDSNTANEVGNRLINSPGNSFSVWSTYRYRRLTFGGGPRYAGRRYGNITNTRGVDGYWTLDALASYPVMKQLDLRLNLYNLNNAFYFERLGGDHLVPGPSRAITASNKLPLLAMILKATARETEY